MVREMEESPGGARAWLIPTLGGEPYLARAPLGYWLAAVSNALPVPGVDAEAKRLWAYRLPSLVCALLSLWLTWELGRRLFDARIAFLALAVQATSGLFFLNAAWLSSAVTFAFFCQLALTGLALANHGGGARWKVLAGVGLVAASLAKSPPLALFCVLGPFGLHVVLDGGLSSLRKGLRAVGGRRLALAYLAGTAPWYAYAAATHGTALVEQHLLAQHWSRLSNAVLDPEPPYYYLVALVWAFLPWSLFLPGGWLHGKDRMRLGGRRLCMVWSIFVLIALSLVSSKRADLLLVIWPPLSLLIAAAICEEERPFSLYEGYLGDGVLRSFPVLLKVPLFFVLIAGGAWYLGLHEKLESPRLEALGFKDVLADRTLVTGHLALAVVGGAVAFAAAGRVRRLLAAKELPRAAFEVACAVVFVFFAASFFLPAFNRVGSARSYLERVEARIGEAPLATYGRVRHPAVLYYAGRDVRHFREILPLVEPGSAEAARRDEIEAYLKQPRPVFVLISQAELEGLKTQFPGVHALLRETGEKGGLGTGEEFALMENGR